MLGVICAMAVEVEGLKAMMTDAQNIKYANMVFTKGKIGEKDVIAVECGVGKVNAAMCAQAMIDKFAVTEVINSGVAGSLSRKLRICDTVIGTEVVEHDMNVTALGDARGEITFPDGNRIFFPCDEEIAEKLYRICQEIGGATALKGRIASGDIFISDIADREKIHDRFDALACEMEGAAIGHVCFRNGIPFCVFRAISDDLEQNEGMDFRAFCEIASKRSIEVIGKYAGK